MFQLIVHQPGTNCSPNASSSGGSWISLQEPLNVKVGLIKCAFVALGLVNLVLNSVSLAVFLGQRQKESIIRLLLLMLSSTEVVASFGMTSVEASRLALEVAPHRVGYSSEEPARHVVRYLSVTWVLANAFLLARNWCVVLIAVSRCEAVVRPFSRNTGRCCSHRTVAVTFSGIVLLGLAFGVPKAFQEKYFYCYETGRIDAKESFLPFAMYGEFYLVSVFFQAVLPVLIVSVASVAMMIGLRRHRDLGAGTSSTHMKATRMVQLLLLVFVLMEMPMFLTVLLGVKGGDGTVSDTFMVYAIEISNLCINLDSTCNFAVYMKTNSAFRAVVLRRRRRLQKLETAGRSDGVSLRNKGLSTSAPRHQFIALPGQKTANTACPPPSPPPVISLSRDALNL